MPASFLTESRPCYQGKGGAGGLQQAKATSVAWLSVPGRQDAKAGGQKRLQRLKMQQGN